MSGLLQIGNAIRKHCGNWGFKVSKSRRDLLRLLRGRDSEEPGLQTAFRVLAATILVAIVLGLVSGVAGPRWHPKPLTSNLEIQSTTTVIGGITPTKPVGTYQTTQAIVDVLLGASEKVRARIIAPVGAPAGQPAVLFIHGAGTGKFAEAFIDLSKDLATAGIVTMVPDKRLDTYTAYNRDYSLMAQDYLASLDVLRKWPGVDGTKVGLYAESEGCWIAPIMAAHNPNVAFMALVSAPVVSPRTQAAFAVNNYLRNTRVPVELFRAIPRLVGLQFPSLGFEYVAFNVRPYQRFASQPIFMAYGTKDLSMPLVQGAQWVIADAAQAGSPGVTVRYYEGANHGINIDRHIAPGLPRDLARWIQLSATEPYLWPHIAGGKPVQKIEADPVPTPRWFMNGWLVVMWWLAGLAGVVLGSFTAVVRVLVKAEPMPKELRRPLTGFAISTLAAIVGLLAYFVLVARLAVNYLQNDVIVTGGWVVIRVIAIVAIAFGLVTRERFQHVSPLRTWSLPARITYIATGVGTCILVLLLAYWGVYPYGQ